jgi:CheY-like chemotaxis protein
MYLSRTHEADFIMPNLILLDLMTPDMDGYRVIEKVRANDTLKTIPIIVLSANSRQENIDRSYQLGANAFVIKPKDDASMDSMLKVTLQYWYQKAVRPDTRAG